MNNYILYMHTTPSTKVYIGITCQSINKRWKNGKGYIGCTAFYRAIEKYGWNNIEHKILFTGLSKNDACELEKEYIKKYDSSNPLKGYNLTSGGEHCEQTKQSRKQLSDSLKQYYANNPNAKNRISEQLRTRPVSEETKCKMSESRKKYLIENPDARKKCGDSFRGKHRVLTNQ
ncbi:MAG: GIY-YIG nuclease family protein, partial [Clostridia bacterium]|nr:GIY-YIG nuclease family protein [Clostridia bacterium]